MEDEDHKCLARIHSLGTVPEQGEGGGNTKTPPSKKRHWAYCFTLNNPSTTDWNYLACLDQNVDGAKVAMQEELAPKTGTPHIQGCIRFDKSPRHFQPVRRLLGHRCHVSPCKSWPASRDYCTDPTKRAKNGKVFSTEDLNLKVIDPMEGLTPYPWQRILLEFLGGKPHQRRIYWFWDIDGNVGKSCIAKSLCLKPHSLKIGGKGSDLKFALSSLRGVRLVIIDVPRDDQGKIPYGSIEDIKNGHFFSGKYKSRQCLFNPPHVVVFANVPPEKGRWSNDRLSHSCFQIINELAVPWVWPQDLQLPG